MRIKHPLGSCCLSPRQLDREPSHGLDFEPERNVHAHQNFSQLKFYNLALTTDLPCPAEAMCPNPPCTVPMLYEI
jgi:hypothetical protein